MADHYTVLGVYRTATLEEIKQAYRSRAKETYPRGGETHSEKFLKIQNAYEVLRDPVQRSAYDASLPSTDLVVLSQKPEPEPAVPWRYEVKPRPSRPPPRAQKPRPPRPTSISVYWSEKDKASTGSAYHANISLRQAYNGVRVELLKIKDIECPRYRGKKYVFENGPDCSICAGSGRANKKDFLTAFLFGDPSDHPSVTLTRVAAAATQPGGAW